MTFLTSSLAEDNTGGEKQIAELGSEFKVVQPYILVIEQKVKLINLPCSRLRGKTTGQCETSDRDLRQTKARETALYLLLCIWSNLRNSLLFIRKRSVCNA